MSPVEFGLSFVEGLALIASPCILPVLPLVLSGSVEGGRKRPFGIILGFVLSFTLFAMLSRSLVQSLHIDLDYIKYGSLVLLAFFGCILLSERLSARFSALTQCFANAGTDLTAGAGHGFGSGIVIGLLIGLVWTPCAGPILAAILVQIIRQESDAQAFLLVAAFAFGAGLPMLAIALAGRRLLNRASFLMSHAEMLRKGFGILILLSVAFIASGIDPQRFFTHEDPAPAATNALQNALPRPYPAPELAGVEGWLNGPPQSIASLKGKVVLVDFWTYSCINCLRTLPYLTAWDRQYRDQGLVILGVHAPEFEFEKKRANVEAALAEHGIRYPVLLDNKLDTWRAFGNKFWPAHYLIDREGRVVYTHFGEGQYGITENNIRFLLGLKPETVAENNEAASAEKLTPETYLGYRRMARYQGSALARDISAQYTPASNLPTDNWTLSGPWRAAAQSITAEGPGAALELNFRAKKVFLVLGTRNGKPLTVKVSLNGEAPTTLRIERHSLYSLAELPAYRSGTIRITAEAAGLEAYAFTFGR